MVFIILISIVLILAIVFSNNNGKSTGGIIKTDYKTGIKTMEMDVPNPTKNPTAFLDFIEKTPKEYLWQIDNQLSVSGNLKDIILQKAIRNKMNDEGLPKDYFIKILDKVQSNTYDEALFNIPENYHFKTSFEIAGAFITDRKNNLIFNVEEGSTVVLKREPTNVYDSNAIVIFQDGKILGYVPKTDNLEVSEMIKFNHIAKIADIIYKEDFINVIVYLYQSMESSSDPQYYLSSDQILKYRANKVESKYLKPKKDAEDLNGFYKKKIVITGEFNYFVDRNELAILLYESGADIDVGITEKIDYVIVGNNPGWRKMEKIEQLGIETLTEDEVKKIFSIK